MANKQTNKAAKKATINMPGEGTLCRQVWDNLTRMSRNRKSEVTVADAAVMAERKGLNVNNARTEFYRWKEFNKKAKRAAARGKAAVH